MTGRIAAIILALGAASGCSTLGRETSFADPVSTAGAGPYRIATASETALEGVPEDAIVLVGADAIGSGVGIAGFLFFAAAEPSPTPPDRDPSLAPHEVDFARFGPREIRRAASNGYAGFVEPATALVAEEAWEGDSVFDPWPVVLPDGTLRLYYAAAGGIGVAEAAAVDGTLARVGDGLVLGAISDGDLVPSSPSVVVDDALGVLLYFEVEGGIGLARSTDGLAFELVDGDTSTFTWDPLALPPPAPTSADEPLEVRIGHPGAVIAAMGSGKRTVRLYFEVLRDDATRAVGFAASLDGVSFERSRASIVGGEDTGTPAPQVDESGATRIYVTQASERGSEQRRGLFLAVGAEADLPALPETEPE